MIKCWACELCSGLAEHMDPAQSPAAVPSIQLCRGEGSSGEGGEGPATTRPVKPSQRFFTGNGERISLSSSRTPGAGSAALHSDGRVSGWSPVVNGILLAFTLHLLVAWCCLGQGADLGQDRQPQKEPDQALQRWEPFDMTPRCPRSTNAQPQDRPSVTGKVPSARPQLDPDTQPNTEGGSSS